jgi:hypothetical protein
MNRIVTFLMIANLLLTNCNQKKNIDIKDEIGSLNKLLENMDESSQFSIFSSDSIVTMIGKNGTRFIINPSDLITEGGREINDSIKIELKELTNQYQMAMANAQTVSKNSLLVSGGAYFIKITTQGEKVKLKPKKKIKIRFPLLSQENMSLFSGNRDSLGRLYWIQENINLKNKRDIVMELEMLQLELINQLQGRARVAGYGPIAKSLKVKIDSLNAIVYGDRLYPEIEFEKLEWINCDRFLEIQNKTDLMINFSPSEKINTANIYLIFKDINSVMQEYFIDEKKTNIAFQNIPVGAHVKLVAYTLKDNKIFTYSSSITIKENQTLTLSMKETSDNNLKTLINN